MLNSGVLTAAGTPAAAALVVLALSLLTAPPSSSNEPHPSSGGCVTSNEDVEASLEQCPPPREVREMVEQHMGSLRSYGLPLYAPYAAWERHMLRPQRKWTVIIDGETRELCLES